MLGMRNYIVYTTAEFEKYGINSKYGAELIMKFLPAPAGGQPAGLDARSVR